MQTQDYVADKLPDAVARRWKELRLKYESSVRAGSGDTPPPDVDELLNELAGLMKSVAREQLDQIRRVAADPSRTGEFLSPAVETGAPDTLPRRADATPGNTAPPDGEGAGTFGFSVAAADPAGATASFDPAAVGTRSLDMTGAYAADADRPTASVNEGGAPGFSQPPDAAAAEVKKRKTPVVPGYAITGVLGRGGMGVVYRATQLGLNRTVALKMILAGEHASPAQLARFAGEARAVAMVKHPNIVEIYATGEHGGMPYFSLEYCTGGSLDRKLNKEPQPPKEAAKLLEALARAMQAAHTAGVIHRDIKPANVLLDAHGVPKITDFGLAREIDDDNARTRSGAILGTPSYMSPEQAAGLTKEIGPAADQYSLGATLYDLLTGRPPFQGTSMMETLQQVKSREPVPVSTLQPSVPQDLETICLKALQKEPAKRYASCGALADDLKAFLEKRPIAARPVSAPEKAWRWAKRNPRVAGLTAAAVMLLFAVAVIGTTFAVVFDGQKREAEQLVKDRTEALTKAKSNLEVARESTIQVSATIPDELNKGLYNAAQRTNVLRLLANALADQLGKTGTEGIPDRGLLAIYYRLGDMRLGEGKYDEAEAEYKKALDIADRLLAGDPAEKAVARGNHALILNKLGRLAFLRVPRPLANMGVAKKYFDDAARQQQNIIDKPETDERPRAERVQSLAETQSFLAEVEAITGRYEAAEAKYRESLMGFEKVLAEPPTKYTDRAPVALAKLNVDLGKLLQKIGPARDAEAETQLSEGYRRFQILTKAQPDDLILRLEAAKAARALGDFLLMRGRLGPATAPHETDLALSLGLVQTPELQAAQFQLIEAYYRSATLALKKGDRDTSARLYRVCAVLAQLLVDAAPEFYRRQLQLGLASARTGDHTTAVAVAGKLQKSGARNQAVVRLGVVGLYGLSGEAVAAGRETEKFTPAEKALREKYRTTALDVLEEFIRFAPTFRDAGQLKVDPDLEPLMTEPRYQAVVKIVEDRAAKAVADAK